MAQKLKLITLSVNSLRLGSRATHSSNATSAAGGNCTRALLQDGYNEQYFRCVTRRNFASGGSALEINPDIAIGQKLLEGKMTYNDRDIILYNLGVGVSTSQKHYLQFLYEYSKNFSVVPSFGVMPAGACLGASELIPSPGMTILDKIPGLRINPAMILHGEHYLEVFKPIPTEATLTTTGTVADVLDKKKGALIIVNTESFDEHGGKVLFNQFVTFVQKAGGFGGKSSSAALVPTVKPPERAPDASIEEKISIDQAAIYRLSGDRNPLHIDSEFAAKAGLKEPILHGLSSFGYAVRHVLEQYADSDTTQFKAVKVRFSLPVIPGQTFRTEMWKEGSRVFFKCKVIDTNKDVITGSYVDLKE